MTNTPHELADEFPGKAEAIHALKTTNRHFERLVEEYHEVNGAIHRAETNVEPTDELHENELRKKRLALKDEIAQMLASPAEG
ncbi:MAG: YdcH family protein [Paracoccaceae bacterium]